MPVDANRQAGNVSAECPTGLIDTGAANPSRASAAEQWNRKEEQSSIRAGATGADAIWPRGQMMSKGGRGLHVAASARIGHVSVALSRAALLARLVLSCLGRSKTASLVHFGIVSI